MIPCDWLATRITSRVAASIAAESAVLTLLDFHPPMVQRLALCQTACGGNNSDAGPRIWAVSRQWSKHQLVDVVSM